MPFTFTPAQLQDLEQYASVTEGQAALLMSILNQYLVANPNAATLKSLRDRGLIEKNVLALTTVGASLALRVEHIYNAEGKYGGKCDYAVYEAVEKLRRLAPRTLGRMLGLTSEQVKIVLGLAIAPNTTYGYMLKAFTPDSLKYLITNRWLDCSYYLVRNGTLSPCDTLRCTGTVLVLLKRTAEEMEVS